MYGLSIKANDRRFRIDKFVPLNLGVEVEAGFFDVIVYRG